MDDQQQQQYNQQYQPGTAVPPPDPNLTPQTPQVPQAAPAPVQQPVPQQAVTPGQPAQPTAPTPQPAQQAPQAQAYQPDQQTAYSEANPYGDQQYSYEQPQARYEYEVPVQGQSGGSALGGLLNRRTMLIGAVVILLLVLLVGAVRLLTLEKLELETTDLEDVSFTLETPVGWITNSTSVGEQLDFLVATPPDVAENNRTAVVVSRSLQDVQVAEFLELRAGENDFVTSDAFRESRRSEVSEFETRTYGGEENPTVQTSYIETNTETGIVTNVEIYASYQPDDTVVVATFTYTEEFSPLGNTVDDILSSYRARGN